MEAVPAFIISSARNIVSFLILYLCGRPSNPLARCSIMIHTSDYIRTFLENTIIFKSYLLGTGTSFRPKVTDSDIVLAT